tara:strand:- start:3913 stop:4938 length:1026 start_codon:yes stop_codon:yes gene_type:complete
MKIIKALKYKKVKIPPIWIMRQAGRYLPEFRNLKKKSGGFVNMVYTPKIASEITLQPIKRFNFDAAIIFSDILVIPDILGQKLTYQEGKGPKLEKMTIEEMINTFSLSKENEKLNLIYEAIRITKKKLNKKTALIGFVGAPLTLSFFMFDNNRKKKYKPILKFLKKKKKKTNFLFKILETAIINHSINQIKAGAQIIQIFDTWANVAEKKDLKLFSIDPIIRICKKIKKKCPKAFIIVFPRNVKKNYVNYISKYIDCISVGNDISKEDIKKIQKKKTIQGNLNPEILFNGKKKLDIEITKILNKFSNKPFIFNLSHGIIPGTPIKNVEKLIYKIRKNKNEI